MKAASARHGPTAKTPRWPGIHLSEVGNCSEENRMSSFILYRIPPDEREQWAAAVRTFCERLSRKFTQLPATSIQNGFLVKISSTAGEHDEKLLSRGYLYRSLSNYCKSQLRVGRIGGKQPLPIEGAFDVPVYEGSKEIERLSMTPEQWVGIVERLEKLKPLFADVFVLVATLEYSDREMAEILGISEPTFYGIYRRQVIPMVRGFLKGEFDD
jgi:hypothetical protein